MYRTSRDRRGLGASTVSGTKGIEVKEEGEDRSLMARDGGGGEGGVRDMEGRAKKVG